MGIADFFGIGYKPCNELADKVLNECLHGEASQSVPLPWAKGVALLKGGKLNAIAAIAGNVFGVAKKGEGARAKYKCYYRRGMTGNWFAEIWGLAKTSIIAAPMVMLAYELGPYLLKSIRTGNAHLGENFALFLLGILMAVTFLPRAFLAFGCQFQAASTAGCKAESSGMIALPIGILGMNLAVFSWFQEWDIGAFVALIREGFTPVGGKGVVTSLVHLGMKLSLLAGVIAFAAWFFWVASFRHIAVSNLLGALKKTNFHPTTDFTELCRGTFQVAALDRVGVNSGVGLVALLYVVGIIGSVNIPLCVWAANTF